MNRHNDKILEILRTHASSDLVGRFRERWWGGNGLSPFSIGRTELELEDILREFLISVNVGRNDKLSLLKILFEAAFMGPEKWSPILGSKVFSEIGAIVDAKCYVGGYTDSEIEFYAETVFDELIKGLKNFSPVTSISGSAEGYAGILSEITFRWVSEPIDESINPELPLSIIAKSVVEGRHLLTGHSDFIQKLIEICEPQNQVELDFSVLFDSHVLTLSFFAGESGEEGCARILARYKAFDSGGDMDVPESSMVKWIKRNRVIETRDGTRALYSLPLVRQTHRRLANAVGLSPLPSMDEGLCLNTYENNVIGLNTTDKLGLLDTMIQKIPNTANWANLNKFLTDSITPRKIQ